MKKIRGYISSRPFMGDRVPQSVQNLVIRDYCRNNNFYFLLSATEYAMEKSDLMLFKIINELDGLDGIIAYSLFQLPENDDRSNDVFKKLIEKKKTLIFALEGLDMNNINDINEINDLWKIKKTLGNCLSEF